MADPILNNVRNFPQRTQPAGADRVSTREADPYGLDAPFERAVVYLLCSHRRFFEAMAPNLQHKLMGCRQAQLLVDAAQNTAQVLKHAPQDYMLVLETLAGYVRDGKASEDELVACRQYLEDAEDHGLPPYVDVHARLVPTLQERVSLALMRQTRESFGHKQGVGGTERLIQQYHALSQLEVTRGIQVDAQGAALIREMLTAERMTTGINSIDERTRGGFYVGTTTNFIGGTGSGKSLILLQIMTHMTLVRKENCTIASLELSEALQLARYLANALGVEFESMMKNPEEACARMKDRYPGSGDLRIGFFDAGTTNFGHIRNWRDQIQQETGKLFRGNGLDYLSLLKPSKGNSSQEGHQSLDAASMEVVGYTKENSVWTFTASAPTRENDEIQVKDSSGNFRMPKNNGVGGAYAISKNMDNNIWLVRVADSEEDINNYEIYPVCTKDRLGCSGDSGWKGKAMRPDFTRSRIDSSTSHETNYVTRPEEAPNF